MTASRQEVLTFNYANFVNLANQLALQQKPSLSEVYSQ